MNIDNAIALSTAVNLLDNLEYVDDIELKLYIIEAVNRGDKDWLISLLHERT